MKKKIISISKLIILIMMLILIIVNRSNIERIVIISINLWLKNLIPSIYPVMVIGKLLINNNISILIPKKITSLFNKAFKFNGNILALIIISLIVGSPTAQVLIKEAYQNKQITYNDFKKIIITTSLINPFFFFNITTFLSIKERIVILILNYITTIILWLLIKSEPSYKLNPVNKKTSYLEIISSSFKIMIDILAIIIIFNIIIFVLLRYLNNFFIIKIILINLEITNGFIYINNSSFNHHFKLVLTTFLASFLGLCINNQIKSIIKDNRLYNTYFKVILIKSLFLALISCMFT